MSRDIWFIVEYEGGKAHGGTAELAGAARELGDRSMAVICSPQAQGERLAQQVAGLADAVLVLQAPQLASYSPDAWAQAIVAAARDRAPAAILLPHAPLGRDLAPVLAARLDSGLLSDCVGLEWIDGVVGSRAAYRRKLVARERVPPGRPAVVTCQRGAFKAAVAAAPGAIDRQDVVVDAAAIRSTVLSTEPATRGEEDITQAAIVVAGGRGLGDAEKFKLVQALASAFGGVAGASRPVVDQGWVGHDRQIGSSGVTVRPRLYVALGISGAVQHIVGMRESEVIVAVNKDASAPIFEYAHYGIVDDLFKVVPALIEALRA